VEPETVLLLHYSKEPFLVPDVPFIFLTGSLKNLEPKGSLMNQKRFFYSITLFLPLLVSAQSLNTTCELE